LFDEAFIILTLVACTHS